MGNFLDGLQSQITSLAAGTNRWRLARWASLIPKINAMEPEMLKLNDQQLRKQSLSLRYRAKSGEPLSRLLVEGYALVREAGRRTLNMRHFDVQLLGGIAMFNKSIVEMQTGEGKTLTATLPMYLHALVGKGCHLATVNDYLARRDADWMAPIYQALGMTVGVVETQMSQDKRRKAYQSDVTYGTAKEFGFDFLRDRLLLRQVAEGQGDLLGGMLGQRNESNEKPVQGPPYFALVDEADSILIDEARTPLIISALPTEEEKLEAACYGWSASVASEFVDEEDYEFDHEKKTVELTREGRQKVRLISKPESLDAVGMVNIYRFIERAILVDREYTLDRQYVVREGEIVIVDEFTRPVGRGPQMARRHSPGRRGQAGRRSDRGHRPGRAHHHPGLLPAIRKAGRHDRHRHEFGSRVAQDLSMPRHPHSDQQTGHPPTDSHAGFRLRGGQVGGGRRRSSPVARTGPARAHRHPLDRQIGDHLQDAGGPGNRTPGAQCQSYRGRSRDRRRGRQVAQGDRLDQYGRPWNRHQAGRRRRGDGWPARDPHRNARFVRIDRQLIGRCGRQGDPGTYRQYLGLDDDLLLAGLGPKKSDKLKELGEQSSGSFDRLSPLFLKAQRKVERRHFRQRRALMYFEKERKKMQRQMGQDPYLDTPGA